MIVSVISSPGFACHSPHPNVTTFGAFPVFTQEFGWSSAGVVLSTTLANELSNDVPLGATILSSGAKPWIPCVAVKFTMYVVF